MKKFVLIFLFLSSFILFSVAPVTEIAYAKEQVEDDLEKEIQSNIDGLIGNELESYFNELNNGNFSLSLKDLIKSIINGSFEINLSNVAEYLFKSFKLNIKNSMASILSILALSLISALSSSITSGFKKEGTKEIIHLAIYGAIICTLTITIGDVVKGVVKSLNQIATLFDLSFPIILTILTTLGGSLSLNSFSTITIAYSQILLKIILNVILPLFFSIIIFTFVGHLSDTVKLEKLKNSFKSMANWILGIIFSILTSLVTMQGIVGASIDNLSIKSIKFALSSYIPILGGYLTEGFDIVLASMVIIKNAFGFALFLTLLGVIIAPLIKIIFLSLSLKLVAGFVESVGESKVSSLLYDLSTNFNILLAILGGTCFLIFVLMILVIGVFNGGMV